MKRSVLTSLLHDRQDLRKPSSSHNQAALIHHAVCSAVSVALWRKWQRCQRFCANRNGEQEICPDASAVLGDAPEQFKSRYVLNHVVLIAVCSAEFLVVCLRMCTGF